MISMLAVVDDDVAGGISLTYLLESQGYVARHYDNCADALDALPSVDLFVIRRKVESAFLLSQAALRAGIPVIFLGSNPADAAASGAYSLQELSDAGSLAKAPAWVDEDAGVGLVLHSIEALLKISESTERR